MNNERYIYVFVRQDLSIPDQLVQSAHAVERMCSCYRVTPDEHPAIVVIGCPHAKSIAKALNKIQAARLPHFTYVDPDKTEVGVTAIATAPLDDQQRMALANYRLYSLGNGPAFTQQAPVGNDAEGANADVAQHLEHSVSNGGVAGENPAVGST